ncbi:hypothetical protein [Vibrio metschnikovii]|uniref:hypothetical protein n=1 Tax=Vibrio metschnikovii TaxID=28172 RepID=UPI001C306B92|nr:hypothetical protein [Vibrio metschnikovii]
MENIKSWLKCFDEIKQYKVKPFKSHHLSSTMNEHELNSYVVLQTAFVLFNGNITANQERLYSFYLPSLSKQLKLAEVVSQAQDIDDDKLKEYISLLEEKDLLFFFLLDVLVFSRLDNTLTEEFKEVVNSFCHSLSMAADDINQVVYLSDCILGIEPDNKPKLSTVFFTMINNPVWLEFFAKNINKNNIKDINGGIWYLDKPIELLTGDVSWQQCVVIFEGEGRLDHFDGTFTSKEATIITPIVKVINVAMDMDTVEIKGQYQVDDKVTAFDIINTSSQVEIKNTTVSTLNARAFAFAKHSTSARFENTHFIDCGNENLLGGAVKFVEHVYFNQCTFNGCKAQIGGALFFESAYKDNIVDCHFKDCLSSTEWQQGVNAGALYFEQSSSDKVASIVNSKIQGDISSWKLLSYHGKENMANCYISGWINYTNSFDSTRFMLDEQSMRLSGVDSPGAKNKYCENVGSYGALLNQYS